MYKTKVEADKRIAELCKKDGSQFEEDPYIALYNTKKDAYVVYPKVATLELRAMRTGVYAGKSAARFEHDENGVLLSATTTVRRLVMDKVCKFASDPVSFSEYAKLDWHKEKPHMFLGKIALARAIRHAFPDLLSDDPTVSFLSYEEMKCGLDFGGGPDVKAEESKPASIDNPIHVGDDVFSIVQGVFKK